MAVRPFIAVLLSAVLVSAAHADDKACALVVMHGKWSAPRDITFFARKLEPLCRYEALEMPWAQRRGYDAGYPAALADVARQVAAFRAEGYRRVVVAGTSFGANAALAYASLHDDVDAVIALAPGHQPAAAFRRGITADAVNQARALVAEGRGDQTLSVVDVNQGRQRSMRMRADVYLSYFDPEGLGDMPRSAANFRRPVPLLWVIGTGDPLYPAGEAFAFAKAPPHPASRYVVVTADHVGTPDAAADVAREWLRSLD